MPKPVIDSKKCTNCGTCVEICPVQVFKKGDKTAEVDKPNECIGCRACEVQCPEDAIVVED
jgi:NAD-dependent dihydropyrimidine dehydrogenase PreA subunit